MKPDSPLLIFIQRFRRELMVASVVAAIGVGIAYFTYLTWVPFLLIPLQASKTPTQIIMTTLFEGFAMRLKLSVLLGLTLTLPVYIVQILRYVFPLISKKMKRIVIVSIFASLLLATGSFYLTYFRLIPLSVEVLTGAEFIPSSVKVMLHFNQNVDYVAKFLLYSCLVFQFPIVLEVLMYLKLLKRQQLIRSSRLTIVIIFVVAAIITPTPDMVNQLAFAVPMIILYFGTILVAKLLNIGES